MINDMVLKASEAASYIASKINSNPKIAIILSNELDGFAYEVKENRVEISYQEIPNFSKSKNEMYDNKLIFGKIYDKDVVIMEKKFHYYDGFDMDEITFPIRVLSLLGVETMILTSSAGYVSKELKVNDLMLIKDHINICGASPLRGQNDGEFGTLYASMINAYSDELIKLAKDVASFKEYDEGFENRKLRKFRDNNNLNIDLKEGVYAFMPGPQFETKAEIKMLSIMGADAVGMTVVPEVITANSLGIKVLGITHITNPAGYPSVLEEQDNVTTEVDDKLKNLIMRIIMKM